MGGIQEDIGVMGLDGRDFRKLTNDRFKDRGPKWSHDGKKLAFYSERSGTYQIWTVSPDGSGIEQVTDEKKTSTMAWPSWMPGDRAIYYQTDSGGAVVDLAGDAGRRKTARVRPHGGGLIFSGTCVGADGKSVLGSLVRPDGTSGPLTVYTIADSLYRNLPAEGMGPVWCEEGRTVLFVGTDGRLRSLDVQTGSAVVIDGIPGLTDYSEFFLAPDKHSIYFVKIETESDVWEASSRAD
jgi:hypothetical protein